MVARHRAEVVEPYFTHGAASGNSRPWEPFLTNPMLFHAAHRGTPVGEWILTNKHWNTPDAVYFDVMTVFDVRNAYGRFLRIELMTTIGQRAATSSTSPAHGARPTAPVRWC